MPKNQRDVSMCFSEYSWQYHSYGGSNALKGRPKLAAGSLIFTLKQSMISLHDEFQVSQSHLYNEIGALCCALNFLIQPNLKNFEEVRVEDLPEYISPDFLADLVIQTKWNRGNGDFELKSDGQPLMIPYLFPRTKLALQCNKLSDAVALCMQCNNEIFWERDFDPNDLDKKYYYADKEKREILQS